MNVAIKAFWLSGWRAPPPPPSYTQYYGRTYQEWIDTRSDRLYRFLQDTYRRRIPIDKQRMAEALYVERLLGIGAPKDYRHPKILWRPVTGFFTDHKPSPFMKSFIECVIEQLKEQGHVSTGFTVEIREGLHVSDSRLIHEELRSEVRIYAPNTLVSMPTREEVRRLCTWQPDPS